jgi:hypothetical protein
VVKLNNYLIEMAHLGIFREVRDRHIDTSAPPASTTIAIADLARPGALLEVEAVVVLPADTTAKPKAARSRAARSKPAAGRGAKSRSKPPAKAKTGSRKRK